MSDIHWKLIKKIVDALPKPPTKRALLFNKDWVTFTEKLPSLASGKSSTSLINDSSVPTSSTDVDTSSQNLTKKSNEDKSSLGQRYAVDKLFKGIKSQIGSSGTSEDVPKWKTKSSSVSLVNKNIIFLS